VSPVVSVVIPVHDGEQFIREAIESVLMQTLADLELLLVDDGSTDASPAIIAEYGEADSRVVTLRTDRVGQSDARNAAIRNSRADLVALLDHDDVAYPDRLERQCNFLRAHESVALVGGALTFIDDTGRVFAEDVRYPLTDAEIRAAFPTTTPILTSAAMLRKRAFDEVGGFRRLYADSEDLDLWLRIAAHYELATLEANVVRYRIHRGQGSARRLARQSLTGLAARISARARAEGRDDPFAGIDVVDRDVLLAQGATEDEIARSVVVQGAWLGKAMSRAGDTDGAEEAFAIAVAHAAASGLAELVGHVERERMDANRMSRGPGRWLHRLRPRHRSR